MRRYVKRRDMLICPFCGGEVHITVCDDEGNLHYEEGYEENPWSGLGYKLVHERCDVKSKRSCPIATYDEDCTQLGTYIYDTCEEAENAWKC